MSKFLFHPLTWSILLVQLSTHAVSAENESASNQIVAQLPSITITAEKQDERHSSSQAITQFNHDLLEVPFTKSHVSAHRYSKS
jgi:iron complex outermembrane receptor protein